MECLAQDKLDIVSCYIDLWRGIKEAGSFRMRRGLEMVVGFYDWWKRGDLLISEEFVNVVYASCEDWKIEGGC
jgi:hypothetical protein